MGQKSEEPQKQPARDRMCFQADARTQFLNYNGLMAWKDVVVELCLQGDKR